MAADPDGLLAAAALRSLTRLNDPGAVIQAVAALEHPQTVRAALAYLQQQGSADQLQPVEALSEQTRSGDVLRQAVQTLNAWEQRAAGDTSQRQSVMRSIARIHGRSGALLRWYVRSFQDAAAANAQRKRIAGRDLSAAFLPSNDWSARLAAAADGRMELQSPRAVTWLAVAELWVGEKSEAELFSGCDAAHEIQLNGEPVFLRANPGPYQADSQRTAATLSTGLNRFVVRIDGPRRSARFQLRLRMKSSQAEHERLTQLALDRRGNIERGRELFAAAEKSQCIKCHRLGETGGRVGPDLAGIGSRFSRIHLIESILQPSRTIAPSYGTVVIELSDGRVFAGVKQNETESTVSLGDKEGRTHQIPKSEIESIRLQPTSTMPEGLEKAMSDQQFVDLIEFLASQKGRAGP